jgi:chromosome segregation protein
MAAAQARLAQARQEKERQESVLTALAAALETKERESSALQDRLSQARLTLAALRERRERYETDLARLRTEREERAGSIHALERQIASLDAQTRHSQGERERNEALFKELEQQAGRLKADLGSAQEAQTRNLEAVRGVERRLAAVREALASGREARTAVAVRLAEVKTRKAAVEDTLASTYQVTVETALDEITHAEPAQEGHDGPLADEIVLALKEQLQKVRERLQRLGPINLAAIEEHRELEERYRFLTAQDADLSDSMNSLKEIIHRINRTTEQMFLQTFEELQAKFGEMFARFFQGGRAELVLTEAEEPSELQNGSRPEPGVDIVVQPPGKRLKNIAMLSGGEKTLTAMALLFASFLVRPTPFCILDEIDAPLDEENIGRFTGVLRELAERSQFIVITHNKRTMEVADSLFGVTMEEPGISKLVSVRLTDLQPVS